MIWFGNILNPACLSADRWKLMLKQVQQVYLPDSPNIFTLIIFGFINEMNKTIYVQTFLGAIAGASEMLLPNIVKQIEENSDGKN